MAPTGTSRTVLLSGRWRLTLTLLAIGLARAVGGGKGLGAESARARHPRATGAAAVHVRGALRPALPNLRDDDLLGLADAGRGASRLAGQRQRDPLGDAGPGRRPLVAGLGRPGTVVAGHARTGADRRGGRRPGGDCTGAVGLARCWRDRKSKKEKGRDHSRRNCDATSPLVLWMPGCRPHRPAADAGGGCVGLFTTVAILFKGTDPTPSSPD